MRTSHIIVATLCAGAFSVCAEVAPAMNSKGASSVVAPMPLPVPPIPPGVVAPVVTVDPSLVKPDVSEPVQTQINHLLKTNEDLTVQLQKEAARSAGALAEFKLYALASVGALVVLFLVASFALFLFLGKLRRLRADSPPQQVTLLDAQPSSSSFETDRQNVSHVESLDTFVSSLRDDVCALVQRLEMHGHKGSELYLIASKSLPHLERAAGRSKINVMLHANGRELDGASMTFPESSPVLGTSSPSQIHEFAVKQAAARLNS